MLDYATYKYLLSELDKRYIIYVNEVEEKCNSDLDPLILIYESGIGNLYASYEAIEATLSREEKIQHHSIIEKNAQLLCDELFKAASPYVNEKDSKLRKLTRGSELARQVVRELYLGND
jgi:hypothetical protein